MLDHCHMIGENSEVDIFLSTSSPCHFLFCLTINRKEGAHTFRLRLNVNLSWTTTNIWLHTTEVIKVGTTCIILPGKCLYLSKILHSEVNDRYTLTVFIICQCFCRSQWKFKFCSKLDFLWLWNTGNTCTCTVLQPW